MKITLATIDSAAQIIADMGKHVRFAEQEPRCAKCGTPLAVYYCESRVYAVRCEDCGTITIVKAGNPYQAAERVGVLMEEDDDNDEYNCAACICMTCANNSEECCMSERHSVLSCPASHCPDYKKEEA